MAGKLHLEAEVNTSGIARAMDKAGLVMDTWAKKQTAKLSAAFFKGTSLIGLASTAIASVTKVIDDAMQLQAESAKTGIRIEELQKIQTLSKELGLSWEKIVELIKAGGPAAEILTKELSKQHIFMSEAASNTLAGIGKIGQALLKIKTAEYGEVLSRIVRFGLSYRYSNRQIDAMFKPSEAGRQAEAAVELAKIEKEIQDSEDKLALARAKIAKDLRKQALMSFQWMAPKRGEADSLTSIGGFTAAAAYETRNYNTQSLRYLKDIEANTARINKLNVEVPQPGS